MYPWTAWVPSGFDAVAATNALKPLEGRHIRAARYVDLDYASARPLWRNGNHDEVAYGLEIDLDDGTTWSIIWEQRGYHEGLGIWTEPLIPKHVNQGRVWDVTKRWRRHGPRTISAVELYWLPNTRDPELCPGQSPGLELSAISLRHDTHEALIAITASLDVQIYFSPSPFARSRLLGPDLVTFRPTG